MSTLEIEMRDSRARRRAGLMIQSLNEGGIIEESDRARIHALTRKVTMSDDDLENHWHQHFRGIKQESESAVRMAAALKDLRDRYEERGK